MRSASTARRRIAVSAASVLGLLLLGVALAACGPSVASSPLSDAQILKYDANNSSIQLRLVANQTGNFNGFNFDGYADGEMRVVVPLGWTVHVSCENASSVMSHSCAIVTAASFAPSGGRIAFPGASVPDPYDGLKYRQQVDFTFLASKVGTYRIDCLISGHEADGMWDWLVVRAGGRPSITDSLLTGRSGG